MDVLAKMPDVTVHVFIVPLLGSSLEEQRRRIWCAPDRTAALFEWAHAGVIPNAPKDPSCAFPAEELKAVMKMVNVSGTPMPLLRNGTALSGFQSEEQLRSALKSQ